jgi:hypothetical protein
MSCAVSSTTVRDRVIQHQQKLPPYQRISDLLAISIHIQLAICYQIS